ncbi:MAG: DUF4055 domain-containing protein [Bryobacterales bacterium]|nr:DUF4055 domain-containing protein [Bryobacterales bacterium]
MHTVERQHPTYTANKSMWRTYKDLYVGGERFRRAAGQYLISRNKEPQEVYRERLARVFYENYAGSIIDWYAATLMRREPVLTLEGPNEAGREFFNQFLEDCDRKGTNLSEFYRQRLIEALVCGRSFIAVEFPKSRELPRSRAEEDATGRSRAYLVGYEADEVINWSYGEDQTLDWIVIRTEWLKQPSVNDPAPVVATRWIYYDREEYEIYDRVKAGEEGEIRLTDRGRHSLASQNRVPVFELKVTEGLWLMNKAALLQLEHFNKSNALAWALTMGLFATPVIYSERDFKQVVGESYFIQLGQNDRFGWTEPEGHVYQVAAENLERLKDEIYRVCYQMTQARNPQDGQAQSGASKQRDFSVTQEVLRAYGDLVKESMRKVLLAIERERRDGLRIDVSGLDEFDIADLGTELEEAKKLLELGIQSPTLKKQLFKRVAQKYFCDSRQELRDQISEEIEQWFRQTPDGDMKG